ncbi:MAG: nucleoside-diphosphate-sugar epimerase [Bacteriovoracaceae bacterium]|jgi:nucleoside-diphosphate-sugar epimerase
MKLFLTGGTGFLGSELVERLAPHFEKIYLLCRRPSKRMELRFEDLPNIELVKGDISGPDIIEEAGILKKIKEEVDVIFHGAAYYDIEGPYSSCFMYNVVGTQNILYLANQCTNLKHFHYISTIAVAGNYTGLFSENSLKEGQRFSNHYAKTKYDAEAMVRSFEFGGSKHIYRLGILVGDSKTGKMPKVDGPYYFFKFLSKAKNKFKHLNKIKYLPLPFDEKAVMPFIPVDEAVNILEEAMAHPREGKLNCYHVIGDSPPSVSRFVEDSLKAFGINLEVLPLPHSPLYKMLLPRIGLPSELLLYMYGKCQYETSHLINDFSGVPRKSYRDYASPFYEYAKEMFK